MTTVCGLSTDWPLDVPSSLDASFAAAEFYWGSVSVPEFSQRLVVEAALRWCAPFHSLAEFGCHPGIPNLRIAHAICPEAELIGVDRMPEVETVSPALAASAGMRARFQCLEVPHVELGKAWAEVAMLCYSMIGIPVAERLRLVATKWLILIGDGGYLPTWTTEMAAIKLGPSWLYSNGGHVGMIYRAPGDWPALDRFLDVA